MSTYDKMLEKIKELEDSSPHRDGLDDAYIEGFRLITKEFDCFDGEGVTMTTFVVGKKYKHPLSGRTAECKAVVEGYPVFREPDSSTPFIGTNSWTEVKEPIKLIIVH